MGDLGGAIGTLTRHVPGIHGPRMGQEYPPRDGVRETGIDALTGEFRDFSGCRQEKLYSWCRGVYIAGNHH